VGHVREAMEGGIRVPFIFRWPGKVPARRTSNEIVHIVDCYTTLAHVGRSQTGSPAWTGEPVS